MENIPQRQDNLEEGFKALFTCAQVRALFSPLKTENMNWGLVWISHCQSDHKLFFHYIVENFTNQPLSQKKKFCATV